MTFFTLMLNLTGVVLLMHAIYSSYEQSLLSPTSRSEAPNSSGSSVPHYPLPLDIILETFVSTLLLTLGIIYSAPPLRPIIWNEWAGKIETGGWDPHADINIGETVADSSAMRNGNAKSKGGVGNPYRILEERRAFWDIRASRKVFADFIRNGAGAQ